MDNSKEHFKPNNTNTWPWYIGIMKELINKVGTHYWILQEVKPYKKPEEQYLLSRLGTEYRELRTYVRIQKNLEISTICIIYCNSYMTMPLNAVVMKSWEYSGTPLISYLQAAISQSSSTHIYDGWLKWGKEGKRKIDLIDNHLFHNPLSKAESWNQLSWYSLESNLSSICWYIFLFFLLMVYFNIPPKCM